jgi:hypothetical protein
VPLGDVRPGSNGTNLACARAGACELEDEAMETSMKDQLRTVGAIIRKSKADKRIVVFQELILILLFMSCSPPTI